jgi:hypothetical protein
MNIAIDDCRDPAGARQPAGRENKDDRSFHVARA